MARTMLTVPIRTAFTRLVYGGRYRYTSVLVGLPSSQYKVEYAFPRIHNTEQGRQDITIYGPVQAESIYALAEMVLNMGNLPAGIRRRYFSAEADHTMHSNSLPAVGHRRTIIEFDKTDRTKR